MAWEAPAATAFGPTCNERHSHNVYNNPCSSFLNTEATPRAGRVYNARRCIATSAQPVDHFGSLHSIWHDICLYCELAERNSPHVLGNRDLIEKVPPDLETNRDKTFLTRMCRKCEIREQLLQHRYLGTLGTVFPGVMPKENLMRNLARSTCTCLSHLLGPPRRKRHRHCRDHLRYRWNIATPKYSGMHMPPQLARGAKRPAAETAAKRLGHGYDATPNTRRKTLEEGIKRTKVFLSSITLAPDGTRHVATKARRDAREYAAGPIPPAPTTLRRSARVAALQPRREQPKRMCRCGEITVPPRTEQVLQCMACHGFHFLRLPKQPKRTAPRLLGVPTVEMLQNSLTHPQKFAIDFNYVDATPV